MVGYQRTKQEVTMNDRASFIPFYIVKEESGASEISSLQVGANERLNGDIGMRQITLDEIEKEYGAVEAQAMQFEVLENPEYQPPRKEFVNNLTIWTERFVIQIGSDEMVEWLRTVPRNPTNYA